MFSFLVQNLQFLHSICHILDKIAIYPTKFDFLNFFLAFT